MQNQLSQTERLINVLRDGKKHTVPELIKRVYKLNTPASARLSARIFDLRRKGYEINSDAVKGRANIWWYQLTNMTKFKNEKSKKTV